MCACQKYTGMVVFNHLIHVSGYVSLSWYLIVAIRQFFSPRKWRCFIIMVPNSVHETIFFLHVSGVSKNTVWISLSVQCFYISEDPAWLYRLTDSLIIISFQKKEIVKHKGEKTQSDISFCPHVKISWANRGQNRYFAHVVRK